MISNTTATSDAESVALYALSACSSVVDNVFLGFFIFVLPCFV